MRKWFLLLAAGWLILPLAAIAQHSVEGVVVDQKTGEGIPYVQLSDGEELWISDKNGQFEISVSTGQDIRIERIGYLSRILPAKDFVPENDLVKVLLEPRDIVFGEIVIRDHRDHSVPQSDEIIDEIKMISQPMDAGDLLRGVAGFGVSKRGAYAQEPVFRSFRMDQINVLFDGFIQYHHACPNRMDPNVTHVIPGEIQKVEIIKGPFSVRYGPAMGATLNYLTESSVSRKSGFSGSVETGYEFNGEGKSGLASVGYKGKAFDVYVNGSIKDYEDYLSGHDSIVPSAFNSKDYGVKLGMNPSADQRLMLTWKQSFLRDAKYAGLPMDARIDNSSLAALSYKWKNISSNLLSVEFNAYGNQVDHVMDNFDRKNFGAVEAESTVFADTYGGKLEFNLMPGSRDMLFAGADLKALYRDGYRERLVKKNLQTGVDLPAPKLFTDKIWQDSRLIVTGLFVENKWYPDAKWAISSGLRLDYVTAAINDPEEDFAALYELEDKTEMNLSGNLSASYRLTEGVSMQMALGRGVRSASIDERYINHFAVGKDPYELVGNPDLQPEVNYQVEYAMRYQTRKMDLGLSLFYSRFQNLITAAVDSSLTRKYSPWLEPKFAKRYQNVPDAYQTGLELSADFRLSSELTLHTQYAYTYAQNLSWDEPVSRVPPMEGSLNLSYQKPGWWLGAEARFVAAQNRVAPSFGEISTPGFTLFHLRAGIKPVKGLILALTAENLLDTDYVEFLNWSFNSLIGDGLVREPGRNISLYLKYSF
jgi:iron complex outermembrane receptor protein